MDRPVLALAVVAGGDGRLHVLAVPITHGRPHNPDHGVRLPDDLKRVLGLDEAPSWVITTEGAKFAWPGADVRLAPRRSSPFYGVVSPRFLRVVARSYQSNRAGGESVVLDRYD